MKRKKKAKREGHEVLFLLALQSSRCYSEMNGERAEKKEIARRRAGRKRVEKKKRWKWRPRNTIQILYPSDLQQEFSTNILAALSVYLCRFSFIQESQKPRPRFLSLVTILSSSCCSPYFVYNHNKVNHAIHWFRSQSSWHRFQGPTENMCVHHIILKRVRKISMVRRRKRCRSIKMLQRSQQRDSSVLFFKSAQSLWLCFGWVAMSAGGNRFQIVVFKSSDKKRFERLVYRKLVSRDDNSWTKCHSCQKSRERECRLVVTIAEKRHVVANVMAIFTFSKTRDPMHILHQRQGPCFICY